MVADPHGGEACLDGPLGIVRAYHPLNSRGTTPLPQKPLGILPVEGRVDLAVDKARERIRGNVLLDASVRVRIVGKKVPGPGRRLDRLPDLGGGVGGGDGKAVADVTFAVSIPSEVHLI